MLSDHGTQEKFLFGEALAVVSACCREEHVSRAKRRVAAVPTALPCAKANLLCAICKERQFVGTDVYRTLALAYLAGGPFSPVFAEMFDQKMLLQSLLACPQVFREFSVTPSHKESYL